MTQQTAIRHLQDLRKTHPAWALLCARSAPYLISLLKPLIEDKSTSLTFEDAAEKLAIMLKEFDDEGEKEAILSGKERNPLAEARSELHEWIKRRLLVERRGSIFGTDSLQIAMGFVSELDSQRFMTSTASRLSTVQNAVEELSSNLNPDPKARIRRLERRISKDQKLLEKAKRGEIDVLSGDRAKESIREVFQLTMTLPNDMIRVAEAYQKEGRTIREQIAAEQSTRGDVLKHFLDSNDRLLRTPEGTVFDAFFAQLRETEDLERMRGSIEAILKNPHTVSALTSQQQRDFGTILKRLVDDSLRVIEARSSSEKSVQAFIDQNMSGDNRAVGRLLGEILGIALKVDWGSSAIRKSLAPLPPIAVFEGTVPSVSRYLISSPSAKEKGEFDLTPKELGFDDIKDEVSVLTGKLNRKAFANETIQILEASSERGFSISELYGLITPKDELDAISVWLQMCNEADVEEEGENRELFITQPQDEGGGKLIFTVPLIYLTSKSFKLYKFRG